METKIFRLSNDDDIICQVVDVIEYRVKNVMRVILDNSGKHTELILMPWMADSIIELNETVLNPVHVICEMIPTEDLVSYYLNFVERLSVQSIERRDMIKQDVHEALLEIENTKNLVIH